MTPDNMSIENLKNLLACPKKYRRLKLNEHQIYELINQKTLGNEQWLKQINLNNKKNFILQLALKYLSRLRKINKYYILKYSGYAEVDFGELMVSLYAISQYLEKSKRGKYARRYRKI